MPIEFPIEVSNIKFEGSSNPFKCFSFNSAKPGSFVSIRLCEEEYKDKTFLGLYLGDAAVSQSVSYNKDTKELTIQPSFGNPAIFVFELGKVFFGYESWWGEIESEEQLKEITDKDIENVWYVKALKQIQKESQE